MANKTNEKEFFSISGMRINNVREIGETGIISFSLLGKGLGLYNLKIVKAKGGEFISAPAVKGKDGNYYPSYGVYFSDEDSAKIIEKVKEKLPKKAANAGDF